MKKDYPIIYQSIVIAIIVLVSKGIESILPFTMPSSVIGLVLLFLALSFNLIKLEQVEKVGDALVDNIGLFFVPAGISVINSLGILRAHFVLDILLIFISTLFLLAATGWMTQLLIAFHPQKVWASVKQYVASKKYSSEKSYMTSQQHYK